MISPRQKVMEAIRSEIAGGKFPVGGRIATESEWIEKLNVARGTVRNALEELCGEGILTRKRGVGCFVADGAERLRPIRRTFAVVLPGFDVRVGYPCLPGIKKAAAAADWELSLFSLEWDSDSIEALTDKLERLGISRVLFFPLNQPDAEARNNHILDCFETRSIRYVVMDTAVLRNGMPRGNFVGADSYRAMREVVAFLAEREGVRRFGFIGVFAGIYTGDRRRMGVLDELKRRGLTIRTEDFVTIDDVELAKQGRAQIRQWLASSDGLPEAILCNHDLIALNVLDELQRHGLSVPETAKVVGFDDLPGDASIALASVQQPFEQIGERAAELLLGKDCGTIVQELLPCKWMPRRSCLTKMP